MWVSDPALISGLCCAGVLLNRIFPVWLITLCLIVILTYLTYKTTAKGMQLRLQEQVATSSQSAHSSSLQAVQVDQEPDDTHTNAVHSLLRSISDKPDSPLHSSHADKHTAHSQHKSPASLAAGAALPPVALADVKLEHLISTDSLSSAPSGKIAASSVQDVELVDVGDMHAGHMSHQSKIPMHISHNLRNAPRLVDEDEGVAVDADRMPLLRQQDSQGSAEGTTRAQAHAQMSMLSALPNKNFKALSQLPGHKIIAAVVLWIAFATLQLLKAATARCSTLYWLLYTTQACAAILASVYFIRIACSGQSAQSVLSSEHEQISQSTEPEWTHKVLTMASAVAVAGGAMAGTVGMGGGVVMGPLLLYLQVPPAASAATSTLMILFSSSAATLSFAVDGQIHAGYAITYASLNFVSSFLGVFLIGRAVKRTGKSSTIVLLLAFMMAAGAFISAIFGEVESIQDIKNGRDLTFNTMCS